MLVSVLPVPFADAARQRQYDAVLAALHTEGHAPATVLLGNLGAFTSIEADMLLVQPNALALVVLTPRAGQLTIPALTYGTWQLDGQPLPGREGADNPFVQYQQQLPAALAWLNAQLSRPVAELLPGVGFALFDAPLTFGAGVETQLHRHAAAHDFQLVGDAAQLPARLQQEADSELAILSESELLDWAYSLLGEPTTAGGQGVEPNLTAILEQKLRQLWRWLGAEDIPADPPYGGPPPDQHLRDQQEQARLQQLRQELQAELHQQRQEAATREAARTQELALLRQQLAQAGPSATERQTEQRAKAALEESLRTARAELATRNQELDTRIQQLGQLIKQMQAAPGIGLPAAPVPSGGPAGSRQPGMAATLPATPKLRPAPAPARSFRRLRQAERWGLVALVLAGAGAGTWGVVRWAHHPAARPAAAVPPRAQPEEAPEENQPTTQYETADSLARAQAAAIDTLTTGVAEPSLTNSEPEPTATYQETTTSETAAPVEATPTSTEATTPAVPATTEAAPSASPTPAPSEAGPTP